MMHSPRVTRSQASIVTAQAAETEISALQLVMQEIQQLREERERDRGEREREREELLELRRRQREDIGQGEQEGNTGQCRSNSLNLKPDIFDGKESFYDFIAHFELVAKANAWTEREKALVFAANLRGKARSVLDGLGENFNYLELKSKLELQFGEQNYFQNYYSQFTNRKMKIGEDFASFGSDLERLVRLAYPECSFEVRDKIACAQFILGIPEGLIRQTLQLESISSLRIAVQRAKIVKTISGGENISFKQSCGRESHLITPKLDNFSRFGNNVKKEFSQSGRKDLFDSRSNFYKKNRNHNVQSRGKECWQCGSSEHFRAECPAWKNQRPSK